jgi:hypothetical protein
VPHVEPEDDDRIETAPMREEGGPAALAPSEVSHQRGHDMEELFELRAYIEQGRYAEALQLIEEMEGACEAR